MESCEKTLVLMVDDEPDLLDVSKSFLEEDGHFKVDTSESAVEALQIKHILRYDVIVSDYKMPQMDGIEFLKQLRKNGNNVPFILYTGKGREEVAIDALNAGADFYLRKGMDVKAQYAELVNFIQHAVTQNRAMAAIEQNCRRFQKLVESASEMIEVVDSDRVIRYVNPAVEHYIGRKPDEIIATKVLSTLPKQEKLEAILSSLLAGRLENVKVLITAKHVNGSVRLLSATITRLENGRFGSELIINAKEVPMKCPARSQTLLNGDLRVNAEQKPTDGELKREPDNGVS